MHVEISTSSTIDLWELLGSLKQGTQAHRELVECLPATSLRQRDEVLRSQAPECLPATALTISNIRQGQHLASSKLPFLWKLHEMLDDVEKTGDDDIVSWLPHGSGFRVHKPKSFVQKIIPYYFNQSKYKSFQRQLHLYEFVRTPRGVEAGAYSHPKFVRGAKSLCLSLSPHKIKGKKAPLVQGSTCALNETMHQHPSSLGKRLREPSQFDVRENTTLRHSIASLRNLQCNTATTNTVPEGPFNWKQIQSILVTGNSLAAAFEKKSPSSTSVTGSSGGNSAVVAATMNHPHSGDVVYAFGERPFRFIEDLAGKDEQSLESSCCCDDDEQDDVLLSDAELRFLIDSTDSMREESRCSTDRVL